ncbi:MAG TPA: integrin alpha [Phycisphaerales bacterium]|nr:integrin alpha [Phycisphaerales bacterium]
MGAFLPARRVPGVVGAPFRSPSAARASCPPARHDHGAEARFCPLEPRALLTVYFGQDLVSAFHLDAPLREFAPPAGVEVAGFGAAALAIADVDGDMVRDVAIAAPGRSDLPGQADLAGRVFLFSGRTGGLLRQLADGFPHFGQALAAVEDHDGDGIEDLAVGSPRFDGDADAQVERSGRAAVYSTATGLLLWEALGAHDDELGFALARVDLPDGSTHLMAGAPGAGPLGQGQALVFMGSGGGGTTLLLTLTGAAPGDRFGHAVASADLPAQRPVDGSVFPIPGDARPDYFVGAPHADQGFQDAGAVWVYFDDGTLRQIIAPGAGTGRAAGDLAGWSLVHLGPSLAIGAPGADVTPAGDQGRVFLYGMTIASVPGDDDLTQGTDFHLFGQRPGERFGTSLANLGDLDNRAGSELGVIAPDGTDGPVAYVIQTPDLFSYVVPIAPIRAPAAALAGFGDLDDNGVPDFLLGGTPSHAGPVARLVPAFAALAPLPLSGASPDGSILYANTLGHAGSTSGILFQAYVIDDGLYRPFSRVPGLDDTDAVAGVNDLGHFIAYDSNALLNDPFVVRDGARRFLRDDITVIAGPTDLDLEALTLKRLGNAGDILIEEHDGSGLFGIPRAWHLRDQTLTFLWNGYVEDVTDTGLVLGTERAGFLEIGHTRTWTRAAGTVQLPHFFRATRLNNSGTILGTDDAGNPALYGDGVVTTIARAADLVPGVMSAQWDLLGIDDAGRALIRLLSHTGAPSFLSGRETYHFEPHRGLVPLADLVGRGTIPPLSGPSPIVLTELVRSGTIVTDAHILTLTDPRPAFLAGPGGLAAASGTPGTVVLSAVNESGLPIVFRLTGDQWSGRVAGALSAALDPGRDLATFIDPKDGRTYAVVLGTDSVTLFRQGADGAFADPLVLSAQNFPATVITERLTVFVAQDQRVHIAGLNAAGELVVFYQPGSFDHARDRWDYFYDNLTRTHLAPHSLPTPAWTGELTAYVTPWNGMNIAGLDAAGDIRVVWWAPGMVYWREENLSATAGAPAMTGALAAFVTPWGGINLAGTTASGNLNLTWWVPGFGARWEHNDMTSEFAGPRLAPASLASYVTPWGGLNIAGLETQTGRPAVYWWTPAHAAWIAQPIQLARPAGAPLPVGRLHAVTSGSTLNLFGAGPDGDVVRLFWDPGDGAAWNYQNLTDEVTPDA